MDRGKGLRERREKKGRQRGKRKEERGGDAECDQVHPERWWKKRLISTSKWGYSTRNEEERDGGRSRGEEAGRKSGGF